MIKKITHYLIGHMGPDEDQRFKQELELEVAQEYDEPILRLWFAKPVKEICITAEEAEQLAESLNQMSQLAWRRHDRGEEDEG